MKLTWHEDRSPGFTRSVSSIGNLPCSITSGGGVTVGITVYVGELNGVVCAISKSASECEQRILEQAVRESARLDAELGLALELGV